MKHMRMMPAVLALFLGACAAAPAEEPGVPPQPRDVPQPEQPVEEPRREDPLRIGVIVSSSGSNVLKQYSELVLAGVQVAAAAADTAERGVELVVRDDGGTPFGASQAVQELAAAGVEVIVGPLVDQALVAAAQARRDDDLLMISPTAVSQPIGIRNAYALNVVDTRGAEALGGYARRWSRVGVLYSASPESQRQANAFMEAYRGDGRVLINMPFGSTTNVINELTVLKDSLVEAIYFPGSDRELQIILPQLEYAFMGVQMLGNESWISDAVRRQLPQRVLQGAIVATPLHEESEQVAWADFVAQYEALHRRSLANPVPALGYDAALLALYSLTTGRNEVTDFRGATGVITLRDGHVTRRPFLLRIDGSRLIPIY